MAPQNFRGHRFDARSIRMIKAAEALGGALTITQGAYNRSVGASAGTHSGGGAADFSVRGLTNAQINKRVAALRTVGWAAWHRLPLPGVWGAHIHAVAVGCPDLAPQAARQVTALRNGRDGLAGNGPDPHRRLGIPVRTYEQYLEDDMPLSDDDIAKIAKAVWSYGINHNKPGARVNSDDPDDAANPTWRALSVLENTENLVRQIEGKVG